MNSETPIENALSGVGTVETPTPAPAEKKSKGPIYGMILLAILAVAGIGFGIYEFMDSNKKADEIKDLKNQISNLTPTTPDTPTDEDLFEMMDTETKTIVEQIKSVLTPLAGVQPEDGGITPITTFDELKVMTDLEKSYGAKYFSGVTETDFSLNDKLIEKLLSLGFTEDTTINTVFSTTYRNSNDIICITGGSSSPFAFACGYYKWVSSDTVSAINEFAEAIKTKLGSYPAYPLSYMEGHEIEDSTVTPYQRITISGYNHAALFYRTSPDAEWQYFTGTQDALSCGEYNTQDLKNAYAGTMCYDEASGANSTVQP